MSSSIKYSPINDQRTLSETSSLTSSVQLNTTQPKNDVLVINTLTRLNRDSYLLFLGKSLRLFSFGFLAVMLVIYLQQLGFGLESIGLLFTWTLLGDSVISLFLTSHADRFGRRISLLISALLSFITILIFSSQTGFVIIVIVSILGVISPSGNEIGPFMSIELSALAQVTDSNDRTMLLAWYNLFGSFSSALGALSCGGMMAYLETWHHFTLLEACKAALYVYAMIQLLLLYIFYLLSPEIEVPDYIHAKVKEANPVSLFLGLHKSKWIVLQLSLLFMIDSFAGSFILQSIISSWFHSTYHTSTDRLGVIVFVCNIFAGISALFAAKLANSIGLIVTMVVTHLPSNVLVMLVPLMPNETTAIAMLCARFSISQMDVPTRNAYVQGVVDPDERSAANGVTNVVRSIGAAFGPLVAGYLYADPKYKNYPFYIAGGLKIVYDLLLLISFRSVKPDTERR